MKQIVFCLQLLCRLMCPSGNRHSLCSLTLQLRFTVFITYWIYVKWLQDWTSLSVTMAICRSASELYTQKILVRTKNGAMQIAFLFLFVQFITYPGNNTGRLCMNSDLCMIRTWHGPVRGTIYSPALCFSDLVQWEKVKQNLREQWL